MRRNILFTAAAAFLGAGLALVGQLAGGGLSWQAWSAPLQAAGDTLRALSLSGVPGNLAAWAVVLVICALPLLLLVYARRLWGPRGAADILLPVLSVELFALCFFLVNPTWLGDPAMYFFPLAAVFAGASVLLAWFILSLLRRLDDAPAKRLSAAIRPLLTGCAVLVAFGSAFGQTADLIARWNSVLEGNSVTGDPLLMMDVPTNPGTVNFTLFMLVVLAVLTLLPDLLAALTLLWGAELTGVLGNMTFDQGAVDLCARMARSCKAVAQATALLTVVANLLQLCLLGVLHSSSFNVSIPLFPLALSAVLYLLCRCLERGKQLQDDSDSII